MSRFHDRKHSQAKTQPSSTTKCGRGGLSRFEREVAELNNAFKAVARTLRCRTYGSAMSCSQWENIS
jgi:hypothetical protein